MRRYIQNTWAPFQNLVDYLLVHYLQVHLKKKNVSGEKVLVTYFKK